MNCDRVSQLHLFHLWIGIGHAALLVVFHQHRLCIFVNFPDYPHITVKNSNSLVDRDAVTADDLPFQLVVVFNLHHLVPLAEQGIAQLNLLFALRRRI